MIDDFLRFCGFFDIHGFLFLSVVFRCQDFILCRGFGKIFFYFCCDRNLFSTGAIFPKRIFIFLFFCFFPHRLLVTVLQGMIIPPVNHKTKLVSIIVFDRTRYLIDRRRNGKIVATLHSFSGKSLPKKFSAFPQTLENPTVIGEKSSPKQIPL